MFDKMMDNLTFSTLAEEVESTTLGILCEGGPGSGKTNFASTACEVGQVLVADFDHGLTTFTSNGLKKGVDYFPYAFEKFDFKTKKVGGKEKKVMQPRANIDELLQLLAYAADKDGPFAPECTMCDDDGEIVMKEGETESGICPYCAGTKKGIMSDVKTIVIDGFTSMSDYFLYEIMVARLGLNYDKDKPGFEGYGQLLRALSNVTELLVKCKQHYNIIATVLVKWEQRPGSQVDGDVIANPQIDGSFRNQIGKVLDEFYYFTTKHVGQNTQYLCFTAPQRTVPNLKSRSGMDSQLENPTFVKVREALVKSHGRKK